jgi:hypothetical protein
MLILKEELKGIKIEVVLGSFISPKNGKEYNTLDSYVSGEKIVQHFLSDAELSALRLAFKLQNFDMKGGKI